MDILILYIFSQFKNNNIKLKIKMYHMFVYYNINIRMEKEYILSCKKNNIIQIKNILENYEIDEEILSDGFEIVCLSGFIDTIYYFVDYGKLHNIMYINYQHAFYFLCSTKIDNMKYFLESNFTHIDIHADNEYAMSIACVYQKTEIIKYLIKYCELSNSIINIQADNNKIIYDMCNSNIKIFKYIVEYSDRIGYIIDELLYNDDLHDSVSRRGQLQLIKYLLEYNRKHNGKFNLENNFYKIYIGACEKGHSKLLKFLINYYRKNMHIVDINKANKNGIELACINCKINVVKYLIKYFGDNINMHIDKEKLFINACKSWHPTQGIELVKYLLDYYDRNNYKINMSTHYNSIFMYICMSGNIYLLKYLIAYNNNSDIYKYFESMLSRSLSFSNSDIVKYLCETCNSYINISQYVNIRMCLIRGFDSTLKYLIEYDVRHGIIFDINKLCDGNIVSFNSDIDKSTYEYLFSYSKNNNIQISNDTYNYIFQCISLEGTLELILYIIEYIELNNGVVDFNETFFINICNNTNDKENIIEYFIKHTKIINIISADLIGRTILQLYKQGNIKNMKYLIKYCYTHKMIIDFYSMDIKKILKSTSTYCYYHTKYIIEYLYKMNYKIDIHTCIGFETIGGMLYFGSNILINYVLYLSNHNYSKYTLHECIYIHHVYRFSLKKHINKYRNNYLINNNLICKVYYKRVPTNLYNFDYILFCS